MAPAFMTVPIDTSKRVVMKCTLTHLNINHVVFGIAVCMLTWLNSTEEIVMILIYEFLFQILNLPKQEGVT